MNIEEIEKEIIEEFELFGDNWEEKYEHIIDMGKNLPKIADENKTDKNIITGCQSRVWLNTELKNGKMIFTADSDAIITKGMVAIIVRVFNNQTPQDISNAQLNFINVIGLKEHLSPTRANGLLSMIRRMKQDAKNLMNGSNNNN
ncbi:MAG: SufE family protein [Bacteroidetes bacterium]|nr:SufE family protein [Bacteroidota bacterium]